MGKTKSVFICQKCGAESAKWIGRCPSCGEWNSYTEEIIHKEQNSTTKIPHNYSEQTKQKPVLIEQVVATDEKRIDTSSSEFNRVLGGGLVKGSLVLIGSYL